jgi:hypothetical protein
MTSLLQMGQPTAKKVKTPLPMALPPLPFTGEMAKVEVDWEN